MIKLIISDIDGTLLKGKQTELSPEIFAQIERLRQKGILFAPASGRQYQSLRRLFAPIANEIAYVCENGGIVYGVGNPGEVLQKSPLPHTEAMALAHDILALEGVELVMGGANVSYLCPKEKDLTNRLATYMGNNVAVVPSPEAVPEEIIKICLFSHAGITPALYELQRKWGTTFDAVVSGRQWMDFAKSDKAIGVQGICQHFGIAQNEVLALGDNFNDVTLLEWVGHPYLMDSAVPELRARFKTQCASVEEVLKTL